MLISELHEEMEDYLPPEIIDRNNLCSLKYAFENVHFPADKTPLLQAKYRLIFDELMALQTGMLMARHRTMENKYGIIIDNAAENEYMEQLPYDLTSAQKRVVSEISCDMKSGKVMNRLVQGDVGSGKTAVAEIALYKAVTAGFQGVMMAPTEILAKQHFEGLSKSFGNFGIKVEILTGSQTAVQKREILRRLETGEIQILVGTHAIIQPDVKFGRLGLVITDEQHRFGVKQRTALREKGENK
jgi:ATP-dependent DNA helicase RecG